MTETKELREKLIKATQDYLYDLTLVQTGTVACAYDKTHPQAIDVVNGRITKGGLPHRFKGWSLGAVVHQGYASGWEGYEVGGSLNNALLPALSHPDWANVNVIRLPMYEQHNYGTNHPTLGSYYDLVQQHINAVTATGRDVIVDIHLIKDWGLQETYDYLAQVVREVAPIVRDNPRVMLEIFNEPKSPWEKGEEDFIAFQKMYLPIIIEARHLMPMTHIIVGNPNYSSMPEYADANPLPIDNYSVTAHFYADKYNEYGLAYEARMEEVIPKTVPCFLTEFGYATGEPNHHANITHGELYPEQMRNLLLRNENIHFTAWCVDGVTGRSIPNMDSSHGAAMRPWVKGIIDDVTSGVYVAPTFPSLRNIAWHMMFDPHENLCTYYLTNGTLQTIHAGNGFTFTAQESKNTVAMHDDFHSSVTLPFDWTGNRLSTSADNIFNGSSEFFLCGVIDPVRVTSQDGNIFHTTNQETRLFYSKDTKTLRLNHATKWLEAKIPESGKFWFMVTIERTTGTVQLHVASDTIKADLGLPQVALPATGVTLTISGNNSGGAPFNGKIYFLGVLNRVPSFEEKNHIARQLVRYFDV